MPCYNVRFVFEVQNVPAKGPREAAERALVELARRIEVRPASPKVFRIFLGRAEIGRLERKD